MFAHAEKKPADADDCSLDLAALVGDQLVDVSNLFIVIVIDVQALELARLPLVGLQLGHPFGGIGGRIALRQRRSRNKGQPNQRDGRDVLIACVVLLCCCPVEEPQRAHRSLMLSRSAGGEFPAVHTPA